MTYVYTEEEVLAHRITWKDALRSGKYLQGRGRLVDGSEDNPSYCCLGVGAEISGEDLNLKREGNAFCYKNRLDSYPEWDVELDLPGMAYFGLSEYSQSHLILLNDDEMYNFDEIADVIDDLPITLHDVILIDQYDCGD